MWSYHKYKYDTTQISNYNHHIRNRLEGPVNVLPELELQIKLLSEWACAAEVSANKPWAEQAFTGSVLTLKWGHDKYRDKSGYDADLAEPNIWSSCHYIDAYYICELIGG